MSAVGLFAQHVRVIERVAGPRGPMELEALAVAASPVATGAFEDCVEVIPGCLVRRDDPRLHRHIRHAAILPRSLPSAASHCQPRTRPCPAFRGPRPARTPPEPP